VYRICILASTARDAGAATAHRLCRDREAISGSGIVSGGAMRKQLAWPTLVPRTRLTDRLPSRARSSGQALPQGLAASSLDLAMSGSIAPGCAALRSRRYARHSGQLSVPDRAHSSSLAESAAPATNEKSALSAADFRFDPTVSGEAANTPTNACAVSARCRSLVQLGVASICRCKFARG
jgi:hypothetical protein